MKSGKCSWFSWWNLDANVINLHMILHQTIANRTQKKVNHIVNVELDMQNYINLKASDDKLKEIEDNVTTIRKFFIIILVVVTLNLWLLMSNSI